MTSRAGARRTPSRLGEISLVAAFAYAATVCRQLTYAYLGKRAKLTIGIFFEVCLDQRGVVALTNRLPKRQFNFAVMRIPHANGVLLNRLEANSGKGDKAALRILLQIGFVLGRGCCF